mgnify:CR=1 FL=1
MKILQINNYHYYRGGSETVYLNTGKLLKEKGHSVAYFSSKSELNIPSNFENYFIENFETNPGTKIKKLKKFIYNATAAKKIEELIIDFKPDIAHLHIFYGLLTSSILTVLKKYKVRTIMSVHEYRMLCPVYTHINGKGLICEKCKSPNFIDCIINRCCRNSYSASFAVSLECFIRDKYYNYLKHVDHFIMVSNFIKNKHIAANISFSEKSTCIYNFSEIKEFNSLIKNNDFVYFGRLSKEKGLITLIKAMHKIPKFNLKIIGTGPQQELIRNYIKSNGIMNVKLLGYKSGNELIAEVATSKYTIIPSEWFENNPMSLIESLSYGIPVIGANIGGIPELINNSTGFLFESGSVENLVETLTKAILLPVNDYKILSKNSFDFAQEFFSKEKHYNELMKVYIEVAKPIN